MLSQRGGSRGILPAYKPCFNSSLDVKNGETAGMRSAEGRAVMVCRASRMSYGLVEDTSCAESIP